MTTLREDLNVLVEVVGPRAVQELKHVHRRSPIFPYSLVQTDSNLLLVLPRLALEGLRVLVFGVASLGSTSELAQVHGHALVGFRWGDAVVGEHGGDIEVFVLIPKVLSLHCALLVLFS